MGLFGMRDGGGSAQASALAPAHALCVIAVAGPATARPGLHVCSGYASLHSSVACFVPARCTHGELTRGRVRPERVAPSCTHRATRRRWGSCWPAPSPQNFNPQTLNPKLQNPKNPTGLCSGAGGPAGPHRPADRHRARLLHPRHLGHDWGAYRSSTHTVPQVAAGGVRQTDRGATCLTPCLVCLPVCAASLRLPHPRALRSPIPPPRPGPPHTHTHTHTPVSSCFPPPGRQQEADWVCGNVVLVGDAARTGPPDGQVRGALTVRC